MNLAAKLELNQIIESNFGDDSYSLLDKGDLWAVE